MAPPRPEPSLPPPPPPSEGAQTSRPPAPTGRSTPESARELPLISNQVVTIPQPTRAAPAPPCGLPTLQNPGDSDHNQSPTTGVPVQNLNVAPIAHGEQEGVGEGEVATERSLWDQAVASLRRKDSKYLQILEENFGDLKNKDSLAGDIEEVLNKRYDQIRAKDGVSQSLPRKVFRRTAKFVLSTKDIGMGLARLDPHQVAPIVLGGVYCVAQFIEGATEESLVAIKVTMEIAELFALWTCLEKRQIMKNQDPRLNALYAKLSQEIVKMYKIMIVLLGTLMAYFDSKWRKFFDAFVPKRSEWEKFKDDMKFYETNCNSIKSQIALKKESQEKDVETLKWISSYDIRGAYKRVRRRSRIDDLYSTRCQWVIEKTEFEEWYIPGRSSVLWLRGTIGTGKTTLMARAIHEMKRSSMIEIDAYPLAIFFFEKARNPSETLLNVETCLRSLVRQLSWNYATSCIEPAAEKKHNDFKNDQIPDSALETGDCLELLKDLLLGREAYIMIDAIDECEKPAELLEQLKDLMIRLNEATDGNRFLHLMLCGRSDLPISDYFADCFTITTSSAAQSSDQDYFVETEINRLGKMKDGSLFFKSEKHFPDRLKRILKEKAKGLFRWIEIQIQFFTQHFFRDETEIEDELIQLETRTTHPELNKEYARLLKLLERSNRTRERALKLLKLIECSFWPLSAAALAEAITVSEYSTKKAEVTADDVRRILTGFVSETEWTSRSRELTHFHDMFVIELAHSSVLEYLVSENATTSGFTTLNQHSEAASMCFASITHSQEPSLEPYFGRMSFDEFWSNTYRKSLSDFYFYSCLQWPKHCQLAFSEDKNCHLVESTRDFILSESYLIWNNVLHSVWRRETSRFFQWSKMEHIWHNPSLREPGFVIALYDLTELLRFPEITRTFNILDCNGRGRDVWNVCILFSKHVNFTCLAGVYQRQWNDDFVTLMLATYRRLPKLVKHAIHYEFYPKNLLSFSEALEKILHSVLTYRKLDYIEIHIWQPIPYLLTEGQYLWIKNDDWEREMLHYYKASHLPSSMEARNLGNEGSLIYVNSRNGYVCSEFEREAGEDEDVEAVQPHLLFLLKERIKMLRLKSMRNTQKD